MALNEKKNEKYEKWLEENNLESRRYHGDSFLLFKKDGSDAWVDETGKGFPALSDQKIWEGGYEVGKKIADFCVLLEKWNDVDTTSNRAAFLLSHDEVHNLIHALNEHTTNENLLKRLLTLDENWNDFESSRKAEEIGG